MLKRSKISLMAFISVSLVIIILISLYPDFFVHAADNLTFASDFDISDEPLTIENTDNPNLPFVSDNSNAVTLYNYWYDQGFPYGVDDNQAIYYEDGSYSICADSYFLYFAQAPKDSFIVCYYNSVINEKLVYVFYPDTEELRQVMAANPFIGGELYSSSGFSTAGTYSSPHDGSSKIIDGINYIYVNLSHNIVSTRMPIYYTEDFDNLTSINGLTNYNYTSPGGGSDSDLYPDGSGGSPANNLYLESPDFHFSNKKYTPPYSSVINSGDSVPDGAISFNCLLNDYQTSNASNFSLEFSYKLIYNVDYKNHLNNDIGPFKQTSSLLNNKKNLSIPFVSGETSVPLTDFINDNNTYTISFSDVFSQLNYDSYNLIGLLAQSREVTSIDYKKFDLYCNVRLVSQGAKSNLYSEWYNPITKKGFLVSDAITDNNNPFVMNPNDQADSNPDSSNIIPDSGLNGGSDSSSNSNASNNVVINNNPTINNNNSNVNSNDNSTPWLIDHLFGPNTVSNGAIGDNKVESLTETTGANNWLEVMKQSFSFVPDGFFNQLQLFFGICLGILVVALILRIILDLL